MQKVHPSMDYLDASRERFVQIFEQLTMITCLVVGGSVLIGWVFSFESLLSLIPGSATMKFNSALLFFLCGIIIGIRFKIKLRPIYYLASGICILIGLLTLLEYQSINPIGIDNFFIEDAFTAPHQFPGRMSGATALCFLFIGVGFLTQTSKEHLIQRIGQYGTLIAVTIALIAFIAYMLAIPAAVKASFFQTMAVHTSFLFILIGLLLMLENSASEFRKVWLSDLAGSVLIRRLLVLTILIPIFLATCLLLAIRYEWLSSDFGIVSFAVIVIPVSQIYIYFIAKGFNKSDQFRKRLENKLLKSNSNLSHFKNGIDKASIVAWTDAEGVITYVNDKFCEVSKYSKNELIGQTHRVVSSGYHDHAFFKNMWETISSDNIWVGEIRNKAKDGTFYWVQTTIVPFTDDDGYIKEYLEIVSDITNQKKVQKDIEQMQRIEGLGAVAGGIAHDFNNLLTAIFSDMELANEEAKKNEYSNFYIEEALQAIHSAKKLTNQLLTFSKGGSPIFEHTDIGPLIYEAVEFNLRGSNVEPTFQIADNLWPVMVDKGQLTQVLANLVINARQAMPDGGSLNVSAYNIYSTNPLDLLKGQFIKIVIRDEGCGIPEDKIDRLFEPYFTTKEDGHGIGLSIVHGIINRHHGIVKVHSEENIGTEFSIQLPKSEHKAEAKIKDEKEIKSETENVGLKILFLDDDKRIQKAAEKLFSVLGHELTSASNVADTLKYYKDATKNNSPFDLVITDLTIKGGSGGEVLAEELLKIDTEAKIIVSSGYSSNAVMSNFRSYGFKGSLPKPYTLDELENVINQVMNS